MSSSAPRGRSRRRTRQPAPAGTNWLPPPPPPSPSPRPPRNWTVSAMISTAWRFAPSCASHSRQSRRPSIADRAALGEVLRAALGLVAQDGDAEVVRLVGPLAGLVLAAAVHGDAQAADGGAARRVPQLGVARQVADEDDAVDVGHYWTSFRSGLARSVLPRGRPRQVPDRRCPSGDPPRRHMAHDAVRDPQDARDLVQRLGLGGELEQVVGALRLVVDLVGEPAPAPGVVAVPGAAGLLDQLAGARDDLVLALLRQLRVEHEQDLVVGFHSPNLPSFGLRRPRRQAPLGENGAKRGRKRAAV